MRGCDEKLISREGLESNCLTPQNLINYKYALQQKKKLRQYLFNNGYISNPLLKWFSNIIVILRTSFDNGL
jgi:hypothetical protein